jgi:GT2 family glycosyltransferase
MEAILRKKDLTIIIPVLNCFDYTKNLVSYLFKKTPYKIIVIDNGSTDETKGYFTKTFFYSQLVYIRFDVNLGVAASWNLGIKYAIRKWQSKYFLILNNDILLNRKAIDFLISALSAKKVVLASATNVSGIVSRPDKVIGLLPPVKTRLTEDPDFSCFLLSLKAIKKVGYFDEKFYPAYFEDNDYHYRIKLAGLKAVKTNRALFFHFGSRTIKDNDEIRLKSNLGYVANREYYQKKWGGLPGHEKLNEPAS